MLLSLCSLWKLGEDLQYIFFLWVVAKLFKLWLALSLSLSVLPIGNFDRHFLNVLDYDYDVECNLNIRTKESFPVESNCGGNHPWRLHYLRTNIVTVVVVLYDLVITIVRCQHHVMLWSFAKREMKTPQFVCGSLERTYIIFSLRSWQI